MAEKMPTAESNEHEAVCPSCKGRGRANTVRGSLTCGQCMGSGMIDTREPQDFVSQVKRNLAQKKGER